MFWFLLFVSRALQLRGSSFTDTFHDFYANRWEIKDGELLWEDSQCVYLSKKNCHFRREVEGLSKYGLVHIDFKNDCYGENCCENGEIGTPFTAGQLMSRAVYGWGSFRWGAVATSGEGAIDVLSCFTLKSHENSETPVKLSICVSSRDPYKVSTVMQIGQTTSIENFSLTFDASQQMAFYRIDYTSDRIKFMVDGQTLREVKPLEIKIPLENLFILMTMIPAEGVLGTQEELAVRPFLSSSMRVLRFRYIEEKSPIVHDEPFKSDYSPLFPWEITVFIILFVVLFMLCIPRIVEYFEPHHSSLAIVGNREIGDYILFEEHVDKTSAICDVA